ncbi:MAG: HypC/HybG/HupF family hydrogenase formation chaperone [Desulfovibrionaceae bacterium]
MCLAIPAQIVEILDENTAKARVGESGTYLTASTMLLPEAAQVGDYVIVHAGFCLHKLDPAEAQESLKMFREIASALEEEKTGRAG